LLGINYSGVTPTILVNKRPSDSNYKGKITSAIAYSSTAGSEVLVLGGGYTKSSDSQYMLTLIRYDASTGTFKNIDFLANNNAYYDVTAAPYTY
jgi:hypothetical protein